ncbi:MAG: PAS domain S-box protein [Polyangiaceae bacterium]
MDTPRQRILVVEHEPEHAAAIRKAFEGGERITEIWLAESLAEYRALVAKAKPDIAIINLNQPDGRATEVLVSPPEAGQFPVLITSNCDDQQTAVGAMKAGALDYIAKSADAFANLPRIVERAYREWELRKAHQRDKSRIFHLNSVLRGIRSVSSLIARSRDSARLLQDACDSLVGNMGYRAVWVARRTTDGQLRLVAHSGLDSAVAAMLATRLEAQELPGCVRHALDTDEVFGATVPGTNCQNCAFESSTHGCGVFAAKMRHRAVDYGVMVAASADAFADDHENQELFGELVSELSFALYRVELENSHEAAAQALIESEAIIHNAFLASPVAFAIGDLADDNRLLVVNDTFEKFTGYRREEAIGRSPDELKLYVDNGRRQVLLEQLRKFERIRDAEFRYRTKSGDVRIGQLNVEISRAGAKRHSIIVVTDITDAKRAQLELQQRLRFETLMAELAAQFLNVSDEDLDCEIERGLRRICDCYEFERASVWQPQSSDPDSLALTHVILLAEGTAATIGTFARFTVPWIVDQLTTTRRTVEIRDVDQLPEEASKDQATYGLLGITNSLTIPSCAPNGRLVGAVNFSSTKRRLPNEVEVGQLETLAQLILVVIGRAAERRAALMGRERMRLLTELLDEAPVGVIVHDFRGGFFYVNKYASALHGYSADEFARLSLLDLVAPEYRDRIAQRIRELMDNGIGSFATWHLRKDRSPIHLATLTRTVSWHGQDAMLAVQTDLTERDHAAAALQESEERYRLLAENISDVIWLLDPSTGRFNYISPSVLQLRGYTAEEVMSQPFEASLTPESLAEARKWFGSQPLPARVSAQDLPTSDVIYHQPRKDGNRRPHRSACAGVA